MQVRLDKLYDEIEEIETFIEAVETRLYNIKQEKISGDNVYQFLLFFDNLCSLWDGQSGNWTEFGEKKRMNQIVSLFMFSCGDYEKVKQDV